MWRRLHWRREVPEERGLDELTFRSRLSTNPRNIRMNLINFTGFSSCVILVFLKKIKKTVFSRQRCCRETSNTLIQQLCVDPLWASPVWMCLFGIKALVYEAEHKSVLLFWASNEINGSWSWWKALMSTWTLQQFSKDTFNFSQLEAVKKTHIYILHITKLHKKSVLPSCMFGVGSVSAESLCFFQLFNSGTVKSLGWRSYNVTANQPIRMPHEMTRWSTRRKISNVDVVPRIIRPVLQFQ